MKMSKRARRMQRHHNRKKVATLNLVSLMDIFTILVFFLLINSSAPQQLNPSQAILLPESVSDQHPKTTLTLLVDEKKIYIDNRPIISTQAVLQSELALIPALQAELDKRMTQLNITEKKQGQQRAITILGDKRIPYRLLEKIILTCNKSNYSKISLAVQHKTEHAS
jgi:biopolymer transport protein TolR